MAGKLIELKEAAAQLGISPEKLQDMREAGEIHGYKDGANWKFKPAEIERVAQEMGSPAEDDLSFSDSAALSEDDFSNLLDMDDSASGGDELDNSSILISDEPAQAGHDSSSTVIGKEDANQKGAVKEESDLKLADEPTEGGEGGKEAAKSQGASDADEEAELRLADSKEMDDELSLSDDLESDDLDFESDASLAMDDDSDLELAADSEDDNMVLADSESAEGDLAIGSEDSGIGVDKPSDSGISLETDSSAALELPEDEDMIALDDEMIASPDDATQLQQDEEFLLSPSDEMLGDESSDSGSQVIALDDSSAFDSDSQVESAEAEEPMLVPDEGDDLGVQLEPIEGAAAVAGTLPAAGAEAPEADYSAWNIMALVFVVILLSVTGMLMADVVRNMWTWNGDVSATSGLASSIVEALGM